TPTAEPCVDRSHRTRGMTSALIVGPLLVWPKPLSAPVSSHRALGFGAPSNEPSTNACAVARSDPASAPSALERSHARSLKASSDRPAVSAFDDGIPVC